MEICLPLIKSTHDEIVELTEDPEQFVASATDLCQNSVNLFCCYGLFNKK